MLRLLCTLAVSLGCFLSKGYAESLGAFAQAVAAAPGLARLAAEAEAEAERARTAGLLPDPTLETMFERKQTMDQRMPMWSVTLSQPLPRAGERRAERAKSAAAKDMARAAFAMMASDEARTLAGMLIEAQTARQRFSIIQRQADRMRAVLGVTETRMVAGRATVAERLALENQLDSMSLMLAKELQMSRSAEAQARAMLGLAENAPLLDWVVPTPADLKPAESAAASMAAARADEARAMRAMARAASRPMTAVGLRFEREKERMGNNDTVGLAFMTDLPWNARRVAKAALKAAEWEETGAKGEGASVLLYLEAATRRVAEAEKVADAAVAVSARTASRLEAQYEIVLRESDGAMDRASSVLMFLELSDKATEVELQRIDAEAGVANARAELWRFVPMSLFFSPQVADSTS